MIFYVRIKTTDKEIYFFSVENKDIEQAEAQAKMISYFMFGRYPEQLLINDGQSDLHERTKAIIEKYPVSVSKETLIVTGDMLDHGTYLKLKYDYFSN